MRYFCLHNRINVVFSVPHKFSARTMKGKKHTQDKKKTTKPDVFLAMVEFVCLKFSSATSPPRSLISRTPHNIIYRNAEARICIQTCAHILTHNKVNKHIYKGKISERLQKWEVYKTAFSLFFLLRSLVSSASFFRSFYSLFFFSSFLYIQFFSRFRPIKLIILAIIHIVAGIKFSPVLRGPTRIHFHPNIKINNMERNDVGRERSTPKHQHQHQ